MSASSGPTAGSSVVAVVLNWNGASHTIKCVEALRRSVPSPPRVIIVDNGSTDGSVEVLRDRVRECNRVGGGSVELISTAVNLGYAGGNNIGIQAALDRGADFVLLINNDVEVEPDCLARLCDVLDSGPEVGVAGPILLLPGSPAVIWAAGGDLSHRENVTRLRGNGELLNGQYTRNEDVDYLPGTVLLVRSAVFESIGMFDEEFFCYMEDVDFGRRVIEAGFRCRLVPAAVARHDASASTGGGYTPARKYMSAVNSVRVLRRHPSLRGWAGCVVFDIAGLPLAFVNACLKGRPGAAWAKFVGIVDGLRGRTVTPARVERFLESEAK